jgi:hypothetical protein
MVKMHSDNPRDMSFLPEDYLEKRAQRRTNAISLALFIVVMGSVVAAYYVTNEKRREVQNLQQHVNSQFERAREQLNKLNDLQAKKDHMVRKARVTSVLIERVPRSIILSEMTNKMPTNLSLVEMDLETRVVRQAQAPTRLEQEKNRRAAQPGGPQQQAAPEVPLTEVTIRLIGIAPTDVEVSEFMSSLNLCPLFDNVNLIASEQAVIDNQVMRRFRLEMTLDQDINLHEYEPTMVRRHPRFDPMGEEMTISPDGVRQVSEVNKPSFREERR